MLLARFFTASSALKLCKSTHICVSSIRSHIPRSLNKCHYGLNLVRKSSTEAVAGSPNKLIGKWLLGVSGMVSVAVILGGVTRLTESGLSMVTWQLTGEKMPRSQKDWELEFEQYKKYPEFQMKNQNMTLGEFKFIFWMEYAHRMWGRTIGLAYFLPAAYFLMRYNLSRNTKIRLAIMGTLLAAQGIMGWYMVKSGLENRFDDVNDVPRVSQYRLASHLSLAFVLYALSLSTALNFLMPPEMIPVVTKKIVRFRYFAHTAKALIFITAVSGAFVAGLDAGLVYNSFPKMADKWIPDDILAFEPTHKNFTENPTTVQFDHRILGISTLTLVTGMWLFSRRLKLPRRSHWAINAVALMAWTQATLGVSTLLTHVPVSLAAAHQSGSLVLLSLIMWLTHELRLIKYIPK